MSSDIISSANEAIINIWEKRFKEGFKGDVLRYPPILHQYPNPCHLLFIGLNPSFSKTGWDTILKSFNDQEILKELNETNIEEYFEYKNKEDFKSKENTIKKLDIQAGISHQYFENFKLLARKIFNGQDGNHHHLDLYQYRRTKSVDLQNIISSNEDFFNKQARITKSLIETIKPDILLVANATASREFKKLFNIRDEHFNDQIGTYEINICGKDVVVFLSGMLSYGGTAVEAFKRLEWHIKAVHENRLK